MNEITLLIISIVAVAIGIILTYIFAGRSGQYIVSSQTKDTLVSISSINNSIKTTQSALDLVNVLVREKCVVEFRNYTDEYDIAKSNKAQIKHLIENICMSVSNSSTSIKEAVSRIGLLDKTYIDNYIIDLTTYCIKDLFTEYINKLGDNT